jgi:hypothetical protein
MDFHSARGDKKREKNWRLEKAFFDNVTEERNLSRGFCGVTESK